MFESLTEKEYQDMRGRLLNQDESARFTAEWFRRNPEYGRFHASLSRPIFKKRRMIIEINLEDLPFIESINGKKVVIT